MKDVPLYKLIKNSIIKQIQTGELQPNGRIPSESELAKLFRVSQITSKNALLSLVDDGIIYRIQGKGSFVCSNALKNQNALIELNDIPDNKVKKIIGVLFPLLDTELEYNVLHYLDKYIYQNGYQMIMHNCNESSDEESLTIQTYLDLGVDGLIIFPTIDEHYNESILRLTLNKFPTVLIDRYLKKVNTCNVVSDNFNSTFEAINYLLDQGHKKIAYISPEVTNSSTEDRSYGFEKAFQERMIPINKNLWCLVDLKTIQDNNDYNYILEFLKANLDITAIFTVNLRMLNLTIRALEELGRHIGKDIEIFTFDNPHNPQINYILQDYENIAKSAVELLLSQINLSKDVQPQVIVPVKLILRK
jgi:GntR family transcriptional regulator of arabinose operon